MSATEYYLQGRQGGIVLDGLEPGVGPFRWLQVVNDTVFTTLNDSTIESSGLLIGPTLPAGLGIGGSFTNVNVSSGLVIAYYA